MTELPWEDNLLERKLESDLKDLLKTLVAFANSVMPGHVATVLIGEKDDSTVQGVKNPDSIQKTVRDTCDKIYPPILWRSHVYDKEGKTCVRIEIEYDGETPHFGSPAWVRQGAETVKATDEVFQRLIAFRLSKVRELRKWLEQSVSVVPDNGSLVSTGFVTGDQVRVHPRWRSDTVAMVRSVTNFWVTLEMGERRKSEPLEKITLSWDDEENRLRILIKP
jgi:hypothetical protein